MSLSTRKTLLHALPIALFSGIGMALTGCGGGGVRLPVGTPGTFRSAPVPMGNGTATTLVTVDANGLPTAVGITLTEAALTGLPPAVKTLFEFPLPPQASTTAFNHIELRYWSHGHDPADLFEVQHFDFIPFMITPQERDQITAAGEDLAKVLKAPSVESIPLGFAPIPPVDEFYAEPRYGTRYFDVATFTPVLNHEQPYTTTLFYGYYNGQADFLEIPLTFPYIQATQDASFPIPLPRSVPKSAYYPTRYRIHFDATTREYTFSLEGMVAR